MENQINMITIPIWRPPICCDHDDDDDAFAFFPECISPMLWISKSSSPLFMLPMNDRCVNE